MGCELVQLKSKLMRDTNRLVAHFGQGHVCIGDDLIAGEAGLVMRRLLLLVYWIV